MKDLAGSRYGGSPFQFNVGATWFKPLARTNCADERYVSGVGGRNLGKVTPDSLDMTARAGIPWLITLQLSYSFE